MTVSAVASAATVVWALLIAVIVTDWRAHRSRRSSACPLLVVGGLMLVAREWSVTVGSLDPSVELSPTLGSDLAFPGVPALLVWRWGRFEDDPE